MLLTKPKPIAATADQVRLYLNEIAKVPRLTEADEIILGREVFWMVKIREIRIENFQEGCKFTDDMVCDTLNLTHEERVIKLNTKPFVTSDIRKLEKAGIKARGRMIEANLRLVVSVAKSRQVVGMPLIDLFQEGSIGLHNGIEKFDPEKGFRLSTYATWWIRQAINRSISDKSRIIRLPIPFAEKIRQIKKHEKEYAQVNGRMPLQGELVDVLIAERLVKSEKHYENIMTNAMSVASLNKSSPANDDSEIMDSQACPNSEAGYEALWVEPLRQDLELIIATIGPDEQMIIRLRYGLDSMPPMTATETAEYLGDEYSRDDVRAIEARAMRCLRDYRNKRILSRHA